MTMPANIPAVAVIVVRDGELPAGADETVAEAGGAALVLGSGQRPPEGWTPPPGLALVRRGTGGGAVLCDEDYLMLDIALPPGDARVLDDVTESYRWLAEHFPQTHDALDALFRMGACHAELGNYAASAEAFAQVLEHPGLSAADQIEATARRGLAQYNLHDVDGADRTFRSALQIYAANMIEERLDDDFFVAMSRYYLGEVAHERFLAAPAKKERIPAFQPRHLAAALGLAP